MGSWVSAPQHVCMPLIRKGNAEMVKSTVVLVIAVNAPLIASYHLTGKAQFHLVSSDREKMSLEENLKAQTVDKMEKALDKGGGDL